ncbi:MAG: GNAT family N-acetyltransferase [Patescibacteria group bacterium]
MTDFPDNFEESTRTLPLESLSQAGQEAASQLNERGYEVRVGLTTDLADQIEAMAKEPSIREFCPNDCGGRFADRPSTELWLSKKRATFVLVNKSSDSHDLSLVGYGWVGLGVSDHVQGGETTFAIRIGESGQGQGLATPFARLIVEGAAAIYGAQNMWLETWQSNGGAVHVYHKIGFRDVDQVESQRPTASGESIADTRLYMSLDNELLPAKNDAALSSDS